MVMLLRETVVALPPFRLVPSALIERGMAGPGLLAHVLVSKFADHLPLYRQSVIYAREGVELDCGLLADWVGSCAALLRPLVAAIRRHVLAGDKLHADDTPIPVLAPGIGKTRTARLWTYVRDDRPAQSGTPPAVWFAYSPDRKGIHPQTHLAAFKGILQADAFAGFNALFDGGDIQEAAGWAHARRKFYDLHEAHPSAVTTEALNRIGALYQIETGIRGKPPDERRQWRQKKSLPLIDDLEQWLRATLLMLSRKSDTTAAIIYALNLWPALKLNCEDGRVEIDNSAGAIIYLPVPTGVASGLQQYTRSLGLQNSTASIPKHGCAMSSRWSLMIRSIVSMNSCRGISHNSSPQLHQQNNPS